MSRGLGKVQSGCLMAIYWAERGGKPPPTTYDIAAAVYHTEVNDDGYHLTDAQHVAVKRALEGLQRKAPTTSDPNSTAAAALRSTARTSVTTPQNENKISTTATITATRPRP